MKAARFRLRRIVPVLALLAGALLGCGAGAESSPQEAGKARQPPPVVASKSSADGLAVIESAEHRRQIERVIEAMDRTGKPPHGVFQGGRRGGKKGVFLNAERRLPQKPAGYWIESDVWPKDGPRDAERLVFGRAGEVYWTRDHYETFVRLR